ncbi:hypothetical protein P7H17_15160 [Paenibacillus larvae]|nr:hypothetical protein [Paenibacillus larvae]MDT2236426.1 hypothetical protein [Paenibacillus larvae]MDT2287104.1 hypothetical protein [Paenibacillus larvae]
MAQVTHAEFVRMSQRNDVPCGEVKFYLDGEDTPYLAEVISSADGHKEVRRVYKMQVDPAVDWYDNNMHQAYEEVTNRFADRAPLICHRRPILRMLLPKPHLQERL